MQFVDSPVNKLMFVMIYSSSELAYLELQSHRIRQEGKLSGTDVSMMPATIKHA